MLMHQGCNEVARAPVSNSIRRIVVWAEMRLARRPLSEIVLKLFRSALSTIEGIFKSSDVVMKAIGQVRFGVKVSGLNATSVLVQA